VQLVLLVLKELSDRKAYLVKMVQLAQQVSLVLTEPTVLTV
jgi:hypothetical protein